jgi:hypothetical protein
MATAHRCHKCHRYLDQYFQDPDGFKICPFCFTDLIKEVYKDCEVEWKDTGEEIIPTLVKRIRA